MFTLLSVVQKGLLRSGMDVVDRKRCGVVVLVVVIHTGIRMALFGRCLIGSGRVIVVTEKSVVVEAFRNFFGLHLPFFASPGSVLEKVIHGTLVGAIARGGDRIAAAFAALAWIVGSTQRILHLALRKRSGVELLLLLLPLFVIVVVRLNRDGLKRVGVITDGWHWSGKAIQ